MSFISFTLNDNDFAVEQAYRVTQWERAGPTTQKLGSKLTMHNC